MTCLNPPALTSGIGENKLGEPIGVLKSTRSYERDHDIVKGGVSGFMLKSTRSYERDHF